MLQYTDYSAGVVQLVERQSSKLSAHDTNPDHSGVCEPTSSDTSSRPSSGAQINCDSNAELAAVIDAWPYIPDAVKAGIVAMVKAASHNRRDKPPRSILALIERFEDRHRREQLAPNDDPVEWGSACGKLNDTYLVTSAQGRT